MSAQLPPHPHLDVLKKQARQLLKAHYAGEPEAVARVQAVLSDLPPAAAETFALRHAQQVLAREYGFTSWQAMLDHVGRSSDESESASAASLPVHYDKLARDLVAALSEDRLQTYGLLGENFRAGLATAGQTTVGQTTAGQPGQNPPAAGALDQARLAIASLSACDSWAALAERAAETRQSLILNLEQLRAFEHLHERFAGPLAARLGALASANQPASACRPARACLAFTDRTSYGELVLSLAPTTWSFRLTLDGFGSDVVLSLGPRLVEALAPASSPDRASLLERLGHDLAGDLIAAWSPVARLTLSRIEPHTDPWAIGAAQLYEVCGLQALEVETGGMADGESAIVEVCYPVKAIEELLDDLAAAETSTAE